MTRHAGPEKETHTSLMEIGTTNWCPCHLSVDGAEAGSLHSPGLAQFSFGLQCRKNTQVPINPDVDNCRRSCWKPRKNHSKRLMTSKQVTGVGGGWGRLWGRRECLFFSQNQGCGFSPSLNPLVLGQPQSGSLSAPSSNIVDVQTTFKPASGRLREGSRQPSPEEWLREAAGRDVASGEQAGIKDRKLSV